MTRVEIAESRDLGVLVVDADLTLVDVLVSNIAERACLESASCPSPASWESGMGVVSVNQSHILATSLQIESAARCGLLVSPSPVGSSGASAMSSGFTSSGIYRSAIGFCDQVEGLDPGVGLYLDGASNEVTTEQSTFAPATAISFL
jgi:hypothetical protein